MKTAGSSFLCSDCGVVGVGGVLVFVGGAGNVVGGHVGAIKIVALLLSLL